MKALILIISIIFLNLLTSCEGESVPTNHKTLAGKIISRSNDKEALSEGSQILLNAHGGLTIEDEIFTNDNGTWTNNNGLEWKKVEETTYITALYPHDISNLYEGNALRDILIAQDTLTPGETDVTLTFKHLFASFTLNVDETLVDKIKSIQLTSPQTIENISTSTGKITLSSLSTSTTLQGNGSSSYTFIIPPMEASLTLNITLENGISQSYKLQRHHFESGFVYECRLRDWNTVPGIRSVGDLKTFSQLINEGKEAPAYGEKQADGRMLYRLLADIDLKGVNLTPIGHNQDKPFDDIFDGGGYTISNYTASPYNSVTGLFGRVGSRGIIKNLHLTHCSTPNVSTSSSAGVGLIAASLSGILLNCSVTDGNITAMDETYRTGALAGNAYSGSKIINSYVHKTTISSKGYLGCLVGAIDNGEIINCFSTSNKLIGNSKNECGGFCGKATQSDITNCYNYNLSFINTTINGMVIGLGESSTINYHYSDSRSPMLISEDYKCTKDNYVFFNINTENISTILCNRLNQWIESNQKNYDYPFTQWKEDPTGTLPAIFQ